MSLGAADTSVRATSEGIATNRVGDDMLTSDASVDKKRNPITSP